MVQAQENKLRVAGFGASAGGLEAFEVLFKNMPQDSGISFIVVQHLAPDNRSILPEILQRYTDMPVTQVNEKMALEPDHVYVIPPNFDIGVTEAEIHLFTPTAPRGFRLPIDFLFRSLAKTFGAQSAGVVLSGTGSDGSLGLKAIKEAGGLTVVQDPETTRFTGMPISAIHTGLIDHIVGVEQIPKILTYFFETTLFANTNHTLSRPDLASTLQRILILIRDQTGHDFSLYKPNTIVRRIEHRMVINRIDDLQEYIQYLRQTPLEIDTLFNNMLIGVTSFFRDSDAFETLRREVLPKILENKSEQEAIRIWVPGCSTGEEAISLAILMEEVARELGQPSPNLQIFATDIDGHAINKARDGLFPHNILMDVPNEYLQRYFTLEGPNSYRINKAIRRHLIYAEQSIMKDPPFSNLDLVSCRNLLIYMSADLQRIVLNILHYALQRSGYLFLGGSESTSVVSDLFSTIDQKHRIFQKVNIPSHFQPSSRLYTANVVDSALRVKTDEKKQVRETIESTLLEMYAPPSVVVNMDGMILYHQGDTSMFWATATGEPSWNILRLARPEIRTPLTVGIRKVLTSNETAVFKDIELEVNLELRYFDLVLRPRVVGTKSQRLVVISFEENHQEIAEKTSLSLDEFDDSVSKRMQELEDEVKLKSEYLQSTIQELEASNEELQSVNEEFQSSNEELRSTNEELETSREELQAINEELLTTNAELNSKIEQLDDLNNDQKNILQNINIGLLILTGEMNIRIFNPIAGKIFNLIETDRNRPITQLVPNFQYDNLDEDIEYVLRTLRPRSAEISMNDTTYLMQIHPYRTPEGDIEGSILTFTNINDRKEIEESLRQNQQKLQSIIELLPVGVSLLDDKRRIVEVNTALEQILDLNITDLKAGKYTSRQYLNENGQQMDPYEFPSNRAIAERKPIFNDVIGVIKENGETVWTSVSAAPLDLPGLSAVIATADITPQKYSEAVIRENERRLASVLTNSDTMVFEQDENLKYTSLFNPNPAFTTAQVIGNDDTDLLNAEEAAQLTKIKRDVMETGEPARFDFEAQIDGNTFHYDMIIQPKYDIQNGKVIGIIASAMDITERKQAEKALKESEERFYKIFHSGPTALVLIRLADTRIVDVNQQTLALMGYKQEEMIGRTESELDLISYRSQSRASLAKQIENEGNFEAVEFKLRTKSGADIYAMISAAKITLEREAHVILIINDISERKQAEEQLGLQSQILDNMFDGVYLIQTSSGNIVYANPRFEEMFGYNPDELVGQHVSIVNAPGTHAPEETTNQIVQILNEKGVWHGKVHNIRKDGATFWCHARVSTFTHAEYGEVWIAVHKDLTP